MCGNCEKVRGRMLYLMEKERLRTMPFLLFDDCDVPGEETAAGKKGDEQDSNGGGAAAATAAVPEALRRSGLRQGEPARPVVVVFAAAADALVRGARELPARGAAAAGALGDALRGGSALRGPCLVAAGCGIPCAAWIVQNASVSTCLRGTLVVLLVGIGAYWSVVDLAARGRLERDRAVAAARRQIDGAVLDDVLQRLLSPAVEGSVSNVLARAAGTAAAACAAYAVPAITLEHRLLLARSGLGLTAEQADALLCRPGGARVLWDLCRRPPPSSLEAPSPAPRLLEGGDSGNSSRATSEPANGSATIPENIDVTDAPRYEKPPEPFRSASSPLAQHGTPPRGASDEACSESSSGEGGTPVRSPLESPSGGLPSSPLHREANGGFARTTTSRRIESRATNGGRLPPSASPLPQHHDPSPSLRPTRAEQLSAPSREPAAGAEPESPWSVLLSIVAEHVSENYVRPCLPPPPPESALERCLAVSLGVLSAQLVLSRRSRRAASSALRAGLLAASSALAALSLGLLLVLYRPGDGTTTQGPAEARAGDLLGNFSHALAQRLIGLVRASLSNAERVGESSSEALLDPHPKSSAPADVGTPTGAASWALGLLRGGWRALDARVARPIAVQAVRRRHALSAFAVALLLARWKEQQHRRRRLQPAQPHGQVHYRRPVQTTARPFGM